MKTTHSADVDVFTAVAHPVRREILDYLRDHQMSVTALSQYFDTSRPAISQHLAVLLEVGLVSVEKKGRENLYQLEAEPLQQIEAWLRHYHQFWNRKLNHLGEVLDSKFGSKDE